MKTSLLRKLALCCLIAAGNQIFAEESELIQQIYVYHQTDTVDRYVYYYDTTGNKILELRQYVINNQSYNKNVSTTEWIYDEQDRCVMQRMQRWIGNNKWQITQETSSVYDADGQITEQVQIKFNNGDEIEKTRIMNAYSPSGQLLTYTLSKYDDSTEVWTDLLLKTYYYTDEVTLPDSVDEIGIDTTRTRFVYDTLSRPVMQELLVMQDSQWVNQYQYIWFYTDDQLTYQTVKQWEEVNGQYQWVNSQNTVYEYDATGLKTLEKTQKWAGMFWQNDSRYLYEYNTDGRPVSRTLQECLYKDWRTLSAVAYEYEDNPHKETVTSTYDFWGGTAGQYASTMLQVVFNNDDELYSKTGHRIEVIYTVPEVDTQNKFAQMPILLYPNPSEGIFYVNAQDAPVIGWKAYSLNGQLISHHANDYQTGIIDMTGTAQGVYIIEIQTEAGIQHCRAIIR